MIHNKSYLKSDPNIKYDIAIYDPPFNEWYKIKDICNAKIKICFVNENYRKIVEEKFGKPTQVIVWNFKNKGFVNHKSLRRNHEYVLIYGKILHESYFGLFNWKLVKQDKGVRRMTYQLKKKQLYNPRTNKQITSVIEESKSIRKGASSFQKPEFLSFQVLDWLGLKGDKVWDGFAGYGIFGKTCKKLGYDYIGYEIDKDLVSKANKEISELDIESVIQERRKMNYNYLKKKKAILKNNLEDVDKTLEMLKYDIKKEKEFDI